MLNLPISSWGNYHKTSSELWPVYWRDQAIDFTQTKKEILAYGKGRSYGDSCLNDGGVLLQTQKLNRFIDLDAEKGLLTCEAGLTFAEILPIIIAKGWFLPVVPGTKFITVGGAIANDIHGKNHHHSGTFGRYVKRFELLRSDNKRLICSSDANADVFSATIGGLGLTGLITWAEIALIPVQSPYLNVECIKFNNLAEFFELNNCSHDFTYTVAWLDCLHAGKSLGRGIYLRANHASITNEKYSARKSVNLPVYFPSFILNPYSMKAFNFLYFHKQYKKVIKNVIDYDTFFFQLDAVHQWNKIYGKRGFLQYQCVVPDQETITRILKHIVQSKQASFLSVLKTFGDIASPGLLSFPKEGITLALDFPNQYQKTLDLLNILDKLVLESGGRLYPAKDARMSGTAFQSFYPIWEDFLKWKDPRFCSDFWRRVTLK